jgi:signal transduction histidine kinase
MYGDGRTILYVEDNPDNKLLVRRVLEAEGYRVVEADDGLSGVRMAEEVQPDLILMDINIPGMDGYAAATKIKSIDRLRHVPVVALTANVMHGDRERTLAAGCDGYLQKPIDIDLLVEAVQEYLKGKREDMGAEQKAVYLEQYSRDLVSKLEAQITQLEKTNEELRALDKLKSEFVSTVSHELRTPLNIIIGHAEILQDQLFGELNTHQGRYVENIVRSARHLLELVEDILDLSKIESGKLELHRTCFQLSSAIDEVNTLVGPMSETKNIKLTYEMTPSLDRIWADRLRFKQIIYNLISNAIKFTPEGGSVDVLGWRSGDKDVTFQVRDTGIGIDPAYHEIIFERFRQIDSSASRQWEGTGLGLALAKQFVDLHEGKIAVKSALGKGSTFTFNIPQKEEY